MKNILFLVGLCYPTGSANGICALEVAKSFSKKYNVSIVCDRKNGEDSFYKYEDISVYKSPQRLVDSLFDLYEKIKNVKLKKVINLVRYFIQKFQQFFCSIFYPFYGSIHLLRQYHLALNVCKEKNIDTVFIVVHPVESFIIAKFLKKKFKKIKLILYSLDRFSYGIKIDSRLVRFKNKKMTDWEIKMFNLCDIILILKSYKDFYSSNKYNFCRNKIIYIDIPLFSKLNHDNIKNVNKECTRFVYSGALYSDIRSPKYLCELFNKISNEKYVLDFYSRGDCQKMLENYAAKNNNIHCNGYVTREENINNLFSSDIIVSIGSINCDMVPSKIFEYMSTGKKIMHIISYDNDAAVPYLKKYPNVLFIDSRDNIDENIDKLLKFIEKKESEIDDKLLDKLFKMNKPDYTVKLIENNLK